MHIRKYDFDYSRRHFMEKTAKGAGSAGILSALWPLMAHSGDSYKAYPEELTDIEAYTKGKVKVGDVIDKDNVELVQDLIDPMLFQEITQDGRKFFILPTQTETKVHFPPYYLDATLKNWGQAQFGPDGNVYTKDGKPWIGGHPFPDAQTGEECIANITLSWGRHDADIFAIPTYALDPEGEIQYEYHFVWAQQQTVGLVHPENMNKNGPYLPGKEDMLRFQSVWFTEPNDVKGTAFMNEWYYDQAKFPELFGYLPAFKRVRRFPTNQRFEPLVAGINLFLSDAWAAGDPMLTWGNWKIIHRGPYLGAMHYNWRPDQDNWEHPTHAGPKDNTYYYVGKSLIPEIIVLEGEPTGFPRAPLSKRRIYVDARNIEYPQAISYDRRGEIWKSFEPGFAYYDTDEDKGKPGVPDYGSHRKTATDGRTEWSWNWVISNDIQSKRVTRFCQSETCAGGWKSGWDNQGSADEFISSYMTQTAMRRLGT